VGGRPDCETVIQNQRRPSSSASFNLPSVIPHHSQNPLFLSTSPHFAHAASPSSPATQTRYRLITYQSSLASGLPVNRPLAPSLSSSRLRFPPSLLALVGGSWTVCFPFHFTSVLFEVSWFFIVQHNGLRNQQATASAQRARFAGSHQVRYRKR
jgi:hypothetical protein